MDAWVVSSQQTVQQIGHGGIESVGGAPGMCVGVTGVDADTQEAR
jgi:hypothetical protein